MLLRCHRFSADALTHSDTFISVSGITGEIPVGHYFACAFLPAFKVHSACFPHHNLTNQWLSFAFIQAYFSFSSVYAFSISWFFSSVKGSNKTFCYAQIF